MPVRIKAKPGQKILLPRKAEFLFRPSRYKVLRGGRGSAKSTSIAQALLELGKRSKLLILCTREYQNSISESVHRLLEGKIYDNGLSWFYNVNKTTIEGRNGTAFIFAGLRKNINSIRSIEGVNICWVEEAHTVSKESWRVLTPTIRRPGAEIWVSYNPELEEDPTHVMFSDPLPPETTVVEMNWRDNPWFPDTLNRERLHMLANDPGLYDHVWEGKCLKNTAATIFLNKFAIEEFDTPADNIRFFHGADWGFATDPTALVRCWVRDDELMVDYEAGGVGVDLDDTPALFREIPTSRDWPIKADSARPETISYMVKKGFNVSAAKKWPGSVEDGIAHLRGFRRIVIHPRCQRTAREFRTYSYKVDRNDDILPIIVDANNHYIDALRYSLDGYIQSRGGMGVWERLAADE